MLEEFNESTKKIRYLYDSGTSKAKECIDECNKYLEIILKQDIRNLKTKDEIRFCYFIKSVCDKNLGEIQEALINIKKALQYTFVDYDKYKLYWVKAECFYKLNKINQSILLYDECITYFSGNSNIYELICVLSDQAVVKKDKYQAFDALKLYKKEFGEKTNDWMIDALKDNINRI